MKLIFEIELDENKNIYWNKEGVEQEFNGDWMKAFNLLIENEGVGHLFNSNQFILVKVEI